MQQRLTIFVGSILETWMTQRDDCVENQHLSKWKFNNIINHRAEGEFVNQN